MDLLYENNMYILTHHCIVYISGVASLKYGFDVLRSIPNGIISVSHHVFNLARTAALNLSDLKHYNGSSLVTIYSNLDKFKRGCIEEQGGIVNFNLFTSDGQYIGFSALKVLCQQNNIFIRYVDRSPNFR